MKLNPAKCTFGVTSGEFLGYILTKRGIKAKPKQISAVLDLPDPKTAREIQHLTSRVAALNRLFQDPRTSASHSTSCCDTLYLYIAVSPSTVSSVLIKEDRGEQHPVFYTSKCLTDAETRTPISREDFQSGLSSLANTTSRIKAGFYLQSPTGELIEQSFQLGFTASNNEAEYEALIAGLRLAKVVGAKRLQAFCDSQLVASQYSGDYEAKNERLDAYLGVTKSLAAEFDHFELTKVPRKENCFADALAALGSSQQDQIRRKIPIHTIEKPSITLPEGNDVLAIYSNTAEIIPPAENGNDWLTPFLDYLDRGILNGDKWESR
ncbi:hypothetical protein N665_0026s0046 [Sinapis alba]|nr:hypothetical protein N665_0026s0046 [Sinapis alba]